MFCVLSNEELFSFRMCSPRGADTDDGGSPRSSPGVPLPLHEDDDSSKGLKDDNDEGMLWCTAVVGSQSLCPVSSEPHLSRLPPTPSTSSACLPCSTGLVSVSSVKPVSSPDMSPIEGQACVIVAANSKLFLSPDVSPIHIHPYSSSGSSDRRKRSPSSSTKQVFHGDACHLKSQVSPRTSPSYSSADTPHSATGEKENSSADAHYQTASESCPTATRLSPHYHLGTTTCSPSHHPHSYSPIQLRTESKMILECQNEGCPNRITLYTKSSNHSISPVPSPCEEPIGKSGDHENDLEVKSLRSPGTCKGTQNLSLDTHAENLVTQNCAAKLADQVSESLELPSGTNEQRNDSLFEVTQGFGVSEDKDVEVQEPSRQSSPLEHRTSSNSVSVSGKFVLFGL